VDAIIAILNFLYAFSIVGLSIYGLQSIVLTILFLSRRQPPFYPPATTKFLPTITVQIPLFNERYVAERIIDSVCALDYPADKLHIQVLDDSDDATQIQVQTLVAFHRKRGVDIEHIHRTDRSGYKAGALAAALPRAKGEFIAIFDADFIPAPGFLRKMVPYFHNPRLGMAQARWGHLNAGYNWITGTQALMLDGHVIIEQTARCYFNLPFGFNGTAGIWRRACIEDCGGWQSHTLSEDLDLSYRVFMKGWQMIYVPEVMAQAEVPPQILAFKQQQFRWARGSIQVLLKLFVPLWRTRLSLAQKISGTVHLASYLMYPVMILLLLISLPLALTHYLPSPALTLMASIAGFGPPLIYCVAQVAGYRDWHKRIAFFPLLLLMAMGTAFNNTIAILGTPYSKNVFSRTPKFMLDTRPDQLQQSDYRLSIDWKIFGEMSLALYSAFALYIAIINAPSMIPFLVLGTLGFTIVSLQSIWESLITSRRRHIAEAEN